MISSGPPDRDLLLARQAAGSISGGVVRSVSRLAGGGNNRLYRAEMEDGRLYALKSYFSDPADRRDRLHTETSALSFLRRHGLDGVPAVAGSDRDAGYALFEWIAGEAVSASGDSDIEFALGFVKGLKDRSDAAGAELLPVASEACFSGREVMLQIERRCAVLKAEGDDARLAAFLDNDFNAAVTGAAALAQRGYARRGMDFERDIDAGMRILSPSDFGFHNAIRQGDGRLVFVDFEYFGWDDPVKLTADFLLHPAMNLSEAHKDRFREGAVAIFDGDPSFPVRLGLLSPLFGLRWCMIILNVFLADKWRRRRFAEPGSDRRRDGNRQLEKARAMLDTVREELDRDVS